MTFDLTRRQCLLALGSAAGMAAMNSSGRIAAGQDNPAPTANGGPAADDVRDIGSRVEMFVDRYLVAETRGVTQRLHPPQRREVVLTADRPWEGAGSAYYTLLRDGDALRMYYRASPAWLAGSPYPVAYCLAESRDGVTFERPSLGLYEFEGATDNNIIYRSPEAGDSFSPFLDENPRALAEERYKALVSPGSGQMYAAASADGLRWKLMRPEPISTDGSFDSLNTVRWDAELGAYRMFSRYLDVPGAADNAARNRAVWETGTGGDWVRALQVGTSEDFLYWSPMRPFRYAEDAPREHFYTNAIVRCPGAEHILLSFPKRFIEARSTDPNHPFPGVSDAVFMTSRDGENWDRTFLQAWLRPGLDERNWTQRSNMPAWGIVETSPEEFSLYASEHYEWPDNRLRRLTVRRHGFASLGAGVPGGEFVTHPLRFSGSRLTLNCSTSAAGAIRVQLETPTGEPLPGYGLADCGEIFGDDLARPVTWQGSNGDLRALAGRALRLRISLTDADLYALQFSDAG